MLEDRFDPPSHFVAAFYQAHELAAREAGVSDFGPGDYRAGLRVLLESVDYDANFTETGRRIVWGQIITSLAGRARAIGGMAKIPHLDDIVIRRPVIITGIPRTGTTALHKLMAVDPQFQGLQTWLVNAPMPRPPRETWEQYPAFQRSVQMLKAHYAATPMQAAHNMVADEVDECIFILGHSFRSNMWTSGWSTPTYDAWWQAQSEAPAYAYAKRVIQLIGSNEPEKRWLLKNPGHVDNLDLLFASYPDAIVIHTHRDPARAIPSLCGLFVGLVTLLEGPERVSLRSKILGRRETAKWANAVRKAELVRAAHPGQIIDVLHGDLHADPLGEVRRIYRIAGLELKPEVAAAMQQRIQANPEQSHGKHSYDIADFGLTEEEIRDCFGSYVDQYCRK